MPDRRPVRAIEGRTGPGVKTRRFRPFAASILILVFLLASCASDNDGGDGIVAPTTDTSAGEGDGDGDETDGTDNTDTTDADTADTTDSGDGQDGGSSVEPGPGSGLIPDDPSECGIGVINQQPFYAVANIPEDDPDGGLNIRDNFQGGVVLDTLVTSTVVYVADCAIAGDGGVWFSVETEDGTAGWANSAFLSTEISPFEPTSGGEETERMVRVVLDALAAEQWADAAAELLSAPRAFDTLAPLLERGGAEGDLPALLERYCTARLCDAPYEVIETRGSYFPDRITPEVDVRFDYPNGQAVETFTRTWPQSGQFSLRTLPGQSDLAWATTQPTAETLLATGSSEQPDDLLAAAEAVRRALLSNDSTELLAPYLAPEGIAVSPSAYIAPEVGRRVTVTATDLASNTDDVRIWGYTDGVGTAIVQTVDEWLADYRHSAPLLDPDETSVDERLGNGNTIANVGEVFPTARVVEFHRQGRGELADFNWSSVRLGFEERSDGWVLVAITSDNWTI